MPYLLDTNIFIQARNLEYGFDFCPAFWDWLEQENLKQNVYSIEKVYNELIALDDDLSDWAKNLGDKFFLEPNQEVANALANVSQRVTTMGNYTLAAKNTFFQVADYYLIAHALAYKLIVVTHERPKNTINKIQIPNVCISLSIKTMSPYEMLRQEQARFILK